MADEEKDILYRLDVDAGKAIEQVRKFIEYLAAIEAVGKEGAAGAEKAINDIAKVLEKRLNIEKRVLDAMKKGSAESKKSIDLSKQIVNVEEEITKALSDQAQAAKEEIASQAQAKKEAEAIAKSRAALNKQYLQESKQREAAAIRLIKTFPREAGELKSLAHQYGAARVQISSNTKGMSDYERAVNRVIQRNPQLRAEISKLSAGFKNFGLSLERGTFDNVFDRAGLSPFQLRQLAQGLDRMGLRGVSAFADIATTAGIAGLAVGGVVLGVGALVKSFIALGKKAAEIFKQITTDAVEVAGKFDSIKASFVGVFEGNEDVALAVVDAIRQESIRLGVDVEEIVRKALPLVSSFRQLIGSGGISELAVGLAQLDPKQGQEGAVRVLQAALAGNLKPLKQTFDIDTTPILRAQQELGNVEGLLVGLGKVLEDRGLDFETLGDTYGVAVGKITSRTRDLELVLGRPVTAELTEQINDLLDTINEKGPSIELIMASAGEAIADVVERLGEALNSFVGSLSEDDARQIAKELREIGVILSYILETLSGSDAEGQFNAIAASVQFVDRMMKGLYVTFQLLEATGKAFFQSLINELGLLAPILGAAIGPEAFATVLSLQGRSPLDAFNESISESSERTRRLLDDMAGLDDELAQLEDGLDNTSESALDQADSMIALNNAMRELSEAADAANEAQEKITTGFQDAERDRLRDYQDMVRDHIRDVLDMEEDFSRKREEIVLDYRRKMTDSRVDYERAIEDAGTDAGRKGNDIYLKYARDQQDIEDEKNKKLLEVEEDYQRKLRDLRAKYLFDQREAILANDAVEYLRLQRRLEFELSQEREQNQDKRDDAVQAAEDKRQALNDKLQEELEDARIANQRKLEDARLAYARQIADNNTRLQREIQDQIKAEETKRAEMAKTYERQQRDAEDAHRRKIADLQRQYADEYAIIQKWEEAKLKLQQAYLKKAIEMARRAASIVGGRSSGTGGSRSQQSSSISPTDMDALRREASRAVEASSLSDQDKDRILRRLTEMTVSQLRGLISSLEKRGTGGQAWPGVGTVVGEYGPEIIRPMAPGYIAPTQMMYSPPGAYGSTVYNNQKTNQIDMSMLDPTSFTPAQKQTLKNLVVEVLLS